MTEAAAETSESYSDGYAARGEVILAMAKEASRIKNAKARQTLLAAMERLTLSIAIPRDDRAQPTPLRQSL